MIIGQNFVCGEAVSLYIRSFLLGQEIEQEAGQEGGIEGGRMRDAN